MPAISSIILGGLGAMAAANTVNSSNNARNAAKAQQKSQEDAAAKAEKEYADKQKADEVAMQQENDTESARNVRKRQKLLAGGGRAGTILTSPLGVQGGQAGGDYSKTLLGS